MSDREVLINRIEPGWRLELTDKQGRDGWHTKRLLICGSRNWTDGVAVAIAMSGYHASCVGDGRLAIISGMARGADAMAAEFAVHWQLPLWAFHADWGSAGKAAGPIRNEAMLNVGRPDAVFAFTADLAASRGTAHMVKLAREALVPTYVVTGP